MEARFLQGVAAEASGMWASEFGEAGSDEGAEGFDEEGPSTRTPMRRLL